MERPLPPQSPQDKLRHLSYIEELELTRSLNPITPERHQKQKWVLDAWDPSPQECHSPLQQSTRNIRIKKVEQSIEKPPIKETKFSTPQRGQLQIEQFEKENVVKSRQMSQARRKEEEQCQLSPYKVPLTSIIYPLVKNYGGKEKRRIDRFHSFVARTIRK